MIGLINMIIIQWNRTGGLQRIRIGFVGMIVVYVGGVVILRLNIPFRIGDGVIGLVRFSMRIDEMVQIIDAQIAEHAGHLVGVDVAVIVVVISHGETTE